MWWFETIVQVFTGKNGKFHALFTPLFHMGTATVLYIIASKKDIWDFPFLPINWYVENEAMGGPIFQALCLLQFLSNIYLIDQRRKAMKKHNFKNNLNEGVVCVCVLALFLFPCTLFFSESYSVYLWYVFDVVYTSVFTGYLWYNAFYSRYRSVHESAEGGSSYHNKLFIYRIVMAVLATLAHLAMTGAMITKFCIATGLDHESYAIVYAFTQSIHLMSWRLGDLSYFFDMDTL